MTENKVVAKVNEKEITQKDVMKFLNDIGPQVAMQFQSLEGIKRVVEELTNQELLFIDAVENNLEEDKEFQAILKENREILLKNYALNKLIQDVDVDDEEVKKYFEDHKSEFKQPKLAKASHVLVGTEEEAENILKEIDEGLSFEDAAEKYSTCPSKERGGDLGEFTEGQMVPEFESEVFKMDEGSISKPVKTQHGFHLIKLDYRKDAEEKTFEEVKDLARQNALKLKHQEKYISKLNELKEKNTVEIM